ncbi:flagellar protein FlaG [Alkaliphilus peptidifermentans]|uniref:Flagellar protein FlaG n=1 Tax=Alkaliphilus peptidifermentans DSM 18978 TaxID=1120976 RepID=A0A1G5JF30_9FIRM|nr:flagellar protein FlaG [Alkaliphilus peptidifermentans]SCY86409.1 flagellar protein FlaG [Alkaliphilus peptidifermentans DSM 18978]
MKIEGIQSGVSYPLSKGIGQGSREITKSFEMKGLGDEVIKKERKYNEEQLNKAIEKANKSFQPFDRKFERTIHEKTGAVMVKVIDSSNDEVIRELPPEKILDMVAHMLEVAGILLDKRG